MHHNTLHAFEDLPFQDAVVRASEVLGTRPFQTERAFAEHLRSGRIRADDVRAVLAPHDEVDGDVEVVPGGPTLAEFRFRRLTTLFEIPHGAGLRWLLDEEDVRHRCHPLVGDARRAALRPRSRLLGEVWEALERQRPPAPAAPAPARRRDQILLLLGVDTDEFVHPVLIRLCAAFLDQGIAYWRMPDREDGLLGVFRRLFGLPTERPDPVWSGLDRVLREQAAQGWTATRTVVWALHALQVPEPAWPATIRANLLSLRGWAGMVPSRGALPGGAYLRRSRLLRRGHGLSGPG
ncbi:conserved hypothetical protein [Frankia canadensis]|uniref:Uncharacterized protein n=1 Tax=Frankia canadensis TaxID=1836972 RepID=A0A2I2KJT9_9ACTN|nr:putative inorganic carbon transporter subunit DabA [Frankia canadensis]SNQ45925.1 conserved hypothetical protein [Frankia canadensis]SOU53215.1 conserved hypothetical protein [Frankia canadensis]